MGTGYVKIIIQNPQLLAMTVVTVALSLFVALGILVKCGNLTAMKYLAKRGVAVFSGKVGKDYKLLNYINKEGVGWMEIKGLCYAPIMEYSEGKYRSTNFLNKPSLYGELYLGEAQIMEEGAEGIRDLAIIRGIARGKGTDIRHANFMMLGKCKELEGKEGVVTICDNKGASEFEVMGVIEKGRGLGEEQFSYKTREGMLRGIEGELKKEGVLVGREGRVVFLKCETETDVTMVVLKERKGEDE